MSQAIILRTERQRAAFIFAIVLAVVGGAIWGVGWFVTQDGLAHLYNAHILLELQKPDARLSEFYQPRWAPMPNLAGHLSLMALLVVLPANLADRVMITLTFTGVACAIFWMRLRVSGWEGAVPALILALLLALNWTWLMGFYNFLLGVCLYCLTLGAWWSERERFGLRAALIIAGLLLIGYVCHIVSCGMTVVGLSVLAATTPGRHRLRRCLWTVAAILPLVPLLLIYRGMMREVGQARPVWRHLSSMWSLREWLMRWQAPETLQLGGRKFLPLIEGDSFFYALLSPTFLTAVALLLIAAAMLVAARRGARAARGWLTEKRGWLILAPLLFLVWAIAPDDFGEQHGSLLRPRILLLAMITLLPILRVELSAHTARAGAGLLAVALSVQIAWVWDYALMTDRLAGQFSEARRFVGRDQRLGTMLLPDPSTASGRSAVNPLLHLDAMLGLEGDNVVWNNYQAGYYYFPVMHREDSATHRALAFDEANRKSSPLYLNPHRAFEDWAKFLSREHLQIDLLVVWGNDPRLLPMLCRWYEPMPIFASADLRIFRHRRDSSRISAARMSESVARP